MSKLEVISVFGKIIVQLDGGKSGRLELTIDQARNLAEELEAAADHAENYDED